MFDAVLLDLDGTLSKSGAIIMAAVSGALAHVGADPLELAALQAFVGPPLEDSFTALPNFDAARVDAAVAHYRRTYDVTGPPLYPGTLDTLRQLNDSGLALALATSKPQHLAERVVAHTGLACLLDVVVGSDRVVGRLTKGDVVGEALHLLGDPSRPIMVGDRSHDVVGAAEHGVPCIGVLWGYGSADELRRAGALELAADHMELTALLMGDLLARTRPIDGFCPSGEACSPSDA